MAIPHFPVGIVLARLLLVTYVMLVAALLRPGRTETEDAPKPMTATAAVSAGKGRAAKALSNLAR